MSIEEAVRSLLGEKTRIDVELLDRLDPATTRKLVSVRSKSYRRFECRQ